MKKLIMFVVLLVIAMPALAIEDDVPIWAGSDGSGMVIWEFTESYTGDDVEPASIAYDEPYLYTPELTDPLFGDRYSGNNFAWQDGGGYSGNGSAQMEEEDSLVMPVPDGTGANITIRCQLTWKSTVSSPGMEIEIWAGGSNYTGGHAESSNMEYYGGGATQLSETNLGGGWFHTVWEETASSEDITYCHIILDMDVEGTLEIDEAIIDMIFHDGVDPPASGPQLRPGGGGVPNPIIIDPNTMTVYEENQTQGDFTVSLRNEPEQGAPVTVMIDPNGGPGGGNPDLTLLGSTMGPGDDTFDNRVYITFTDFTDLSEPNWNEPQVVRFVAVDDSIPEPEGEGFDDPHTILVSSYYPAHPTDANYVGEKPVAVTVVDNDKADILFTITPSEENNPKNPVTGPVKLWEEPRDFFGSPMARWRKIGVTLQVQPKNDADPCEVGYVRLIVTNEGESGNQPVMDPNLVGDIPHRASEPNAIVFTSDGSAVAGVIGAVSKWDVPYILKIYGNDDDELQAEDEEGEYPSAEGDEYYEAAIEFFVEATSDERYGKMVELLDDEDDPLDPPEFELEGFETYVDISIEDNDCGAFGVLAMDIGNPNAATDPNYVDDDGNPLPDCYVDIYDVIEMASRWFNCTEPLDPSCWE